VGCIGIWSVLLLIWTKTSTPSTVKTYNLIDASKEAGLEVNAEKTKYWLVTDLQNLGQTVKKHS
jgi:hypothetical protein